MKKFFLYYHNSHKVKEECHIWDAIENEDDDDNGAFWIKVFLFMPYIRETYTHIHSSTLPREVGAIPQSFASLFSFENFHRYH